MKCKWCGLGIHMAETQWRHDPQNGKSPMYGCDMAAGLTRGFSGRHAEPLEEKKEMPTDRGAPKAYDASLIDLMLSHLKGWVEMLPEDEKGIRGRVLGILESETYRMEVGR